MLIAPQRIVSLWEMLQRLDASIFEVLNGISYYSAVFSIAVVEPGAEFIPVKSDDFKRVRECIEKMTIAAIGLSLDATESSANTCYSYLKNFEQDEDDEDYWIELKCAKNFSHHLSNLRNNFSAQTRSKIFFTISGRGSEYLMNDAMPFGQAVDDAFTKASEEISEAAKCLALKRSTAVVFHLMRAMELAVQRLAEALGKNNPADKVWGVILSDIHLAIEAMPKGSARNAWSESYAHLYHVKQAWRNDTMHPKATYTEEQAQNVFDAVKSFMNHLAPLV